MIVLLFALSVDVKSFKQCFSPSSYIVGNSLTRTITITLIPNPLMKFIPSDNMCQVLNGKQSSIIFSLNSPSEGIIAIPPTNSIPFQYIFNKNITISYQFLTQLAFEKSLDAQYASYKVLLDGEYELIGSVSSVYFTLSNQTSCFTETRLTYNTPEKWFSFEVEPAFCNIPVFTPFLEYSKDGKWIRVPIKPVQSDNQWNEGTELSDVLTDFLDVKRYLLDPTSTGESGKYNQAEKDAFTAFLNEFEINHFVIIRLSLDYPVKTVTASVTSVATYYFSENQMECYDSMNTRAAINENNLIFQMGFEGVINCLEVDVTHQNYAMAQDIKSKWNHAELLLVIDYGSERTHIHKNMSVIELVNSYSTAFDIPLDLIRIILDNTSLSATVQLFIEVYDANSNYLLDFNTPFIDLQRTCVSKRILHQLKDSTTIVSKHINDSRCISKPQTPDQVYLAAFYKNELKHLYVFQATANYNLNSQTYEFSCKNDILGTVQQCEENRKFVMNINNRDDVKFSLTSTQELAEIQYMVIDSMKNTLNIAFAIFGSVVVALSIVIVLVIVKSQQ
ncbi:Conserved_hypothetical protein [Hexamita inflata]|uniref:Uncharacterized protein n=1 Tax=Hexamita inflata TaxID=28002 RepID=A0AA86R4Y4_9EUKA|nr:Conserved hypothetical protein [Hexamita inflata]